jgi:hypothetical protein
MLIFNLNESIEITSLDDYIPIADAVSTIAFM